ncbi:MAG: hypothetical protein FWF99_05385 [Desulfovibrionaceae bacterium]|nr:hypothetical protein [Desulfovibrionaceae bacterium]
MKKKDLSDVELTVEEKQRLDDTEALAQELERSVQQLKEHYDNASPDEKESLILDPEINSLHSKLLAQLEESKNYAAKVLAEGEAALSQISEWIAEAEKNQEKKESEE